MNKCEGECGATVESAEFPGSICKECWREAMARMSAAYRGETISLEDDGREEDDGR